MAIIPNAQQFHTLSSTVDTTERGSALANASREVYTMQDIKESISAIDGSGAQYALPVFTDANTLTNLPFGTSGQVLQSNGNTANPSFIDVGVKAGTQNTGIGFEAASTGSGGQYNTVFGHQAGIGVLGTNYNTIIGASAFPNITGNSANNTAVGMFAMNSGSNNIEKCVAVGNFALRYISRSGLGIGGENTGIGYKAGEDISTGYGNVFVGSEAGKNCDTGYVNTGIGKLALYSCSGTNNNVAIGNSSLYNLIAANSNVAVGNLSLNQLLSGEKNVAMGHQAGYGITGNENIAVGWSSAFNSLSGDNNVVIGNFANASGAAVSNEITLGNSSISTLRCQVTSITSLSDERDKTDIVDLDKGLETIMALKPRKFVWNNRPEQTIKTCIPKQVDEEGNVIVEEVIEYNEVVSSKKGNKDVGFIAQELQTVDDDFLQLVYDVNPEKLEASYGRLIPVLVKAIQDLSAKVTELENK
jgi:hypothetical protein